MEMNENLVLEGAEKAEQTAEETQQARLYTQEEVDSIVGKAKARTRAKVTKEYERSTGELVEVLKAGMGKEDVGEITDDLRDFYGNRKGIKMPNRNEYSARDIETLAGVEADEIIKGGFEDVVEEADRLKEIGAERMTAKEKAVFKKLTNHIYNAERNNELASIGVTEDVYGSEEFADFASKFNPNTPIRYIYDLYTKSQPKKNIKPMGSVKNSTSADSAVKDFYTRDEALRFTKKDFDNNPELYKKVQESMLKW